MKVFFIFVVMIFLGVLNISCSSGKKEIHSEQANAGKTQVLPAVKEVTADKDTISSKTPLYFTSTGKDTVTGTLYVTGNEPFTKLALYVSSDTIFHIETDSSIKSRLWQMQGKRVSVIGIKKSSPAGIMINVSSFYTAQ